MQTRKPDLHPDVVQLIHEVTHSSRAEYRESIRRRCRPKPPGETYEHESPVPRLVKL